MSEDPRVELVWQGFRSWEAGDVEATLALYDPEIEVYAPPEVVNSGTYHGHEGFMSWAQEWLEAWESFEQHLVEVEVIGERHALAQVRQTGVGKGSGIKVERDATYLWDVRGGKAVFLALFFDRDGARDLAHRREAAGTD